MRRWRLKLIVPLLCFLLFSMMLVDLLFRSIFSHHETFDTTEDIDYGLNQFVLHSLQERLSRHIFRGESVGNSGELVREACTKNLAILFNATQTTDAPMWNTLIDFSLSSTAFIQLHELEHSIDQNLIDSIQLYEQLLFPWLLQPIRTLQQSFNHRGIVISTGNRHFFQAFLLVKTLRNVLDCDLPIEITYSNNDDLSLENRISITRFLNVKCVDLSTLLQADQLVGVDAWWWKCFSVLLSSFSEVILMDADVLFMVDPATLFDAPLYKRQGALLFKDRQINHNIYDKAILKNSFPYPSQTLQKSGLWRGTTEHELESGALVYDKRNHAAFYALLTTCNLSRQPAQKLVGLFSWGDKESFWMGFESLKIPYELVPFYGATVGYSPIHDTVCGALAHSDEQGKLIWMNGGIDTARTVDDLPIAIQFDYYATDNLVDLVGQWNWGKGHGAMCWISSSPATQVKRLSVKEKALIDSYVRIYKAIKKGVYSVE